MKYKLFLVLAEVTIEFDQTLYDATEGSDIVFTIILRGQSSKVITVEFSTENITATGW